MSSFKDILVPLPVHKLHCIRNIHYNTLKTILHVISIKHNTTHDKDRRTTMQLTIKKTLNDRFIILCHMLRANIPRIVDYGAKIIPCAETLSLTCKSVMTFTEFFTQHALISQKILQ